MFFPFRSFFFSLLGVHFFRLVNAFMRKSTPFSAHRTTITIGAANMPIASSIHNSEKHIEQRILSKQRSNQKKKSKYVFTDLHADEHKYLTWVFFHPDYPESTLFPV